MILSEVVVEIVRPEEEGRFRELMQSHHYLGAMPKIGETLWYVAHVDGTWLALAVFSAPALKCRARDSWVGWDFRYQYGRLHLVSNSSRLLILPGHQLSQSRVTVSRVCARVGSWVTGRPVSAIRCCCWRPLSTQPGSRARSTVPCELAGGWTQPRVPAWRRRILRAVDPQARVSLSPCPERGPAIVRRGARSNPAQRSGRRS